MKFKRILIVSLILAIFAIGAVSASEDVMSDGNLTVVDEIDDSIEEIDDSNLKEVDNSLDDADNSLGESNDEIVGVDWDPNKVDCSIYTNVPLDDQEGVITFSSTDPHATGNLIIEVDGVQKKVYNIKGTDYVNGRYDLNIRPQDLGFKNPGTYNNWVVRLGTEDLTYADEVELVDYLLYVYVYPDDVSEWGPGVQPSDIIEAYYDGAWEDRIFDFEYVYFGAGDVIKFYVRLPADATGKLTLSVDGQPYNVDYRNGRGLVTVKTKNMKLGEHTITGLYSGDSKYNLKRIVDTKFDLDPGIFVPSIMAVHEDEYIKISAEKLSGNVNITIEKEDEYGNWGTIDFKTLRVRNGVASLSLKSLGEGTYGVAVEYDIANGKYTGTQPYILRIMQSNPRISSTISPTTITQGQYVKVHIETDYKFQVSDEVMIYIDDEFSKSRQYSGGQLDEALLDLAPGTYKVNVFFYHEENGVEYFHSNTKIVTVKSNTPTPTPTPTPPVGKDSLTLSTVKVKRSAKKVVLTATLKIKGVAKSGLKVNFKFNGIKYSAKTNSKGVAKVAIKKSVLKKLKVGKKVKYKASYGQLSVTKTAKVQK